MEICHLAVDGLKANPENLFNPLTSYEYEDLRESIARYGVQVPLIVAPAEDGFYTVISGNNRLRVAKEIGIKTLPCSILETASIEGALDTDIFRRHLSPEERADYKALKEAKCEEVLEKETKKKLHPELFEQYKNGLISRKFAIEVMKLNMEEQTSLLNSLSRPVETVEHAHEISTEDEEASGLGEEIVRLNKILDEKNGKIKELKKWKEENQEKIVEKLDELNKEKAKASEVVRGEFEKEVKNLMETNEKLAKQIKSKQGEIKALEEEKEKSKRNLSDKEIEVKAGKVLVVEEERKYMVNIVIYRLDEMLEGIQRIQEHLDKHDDLSKRMEGLALDKIGYIFDELGKLSNRISKNIQQDTFLQKEMRI
ncbi:MAG: ParB N-terminal domain-containing protein [Deltaproteobacteria bacterium]|nr:ParB N-terminal domain-containing protein [Deltaproteobacteria bacterium]